MPSASFVRPMTTREIYAAAFWLYRRHFRPLLVISIVYTVLVVALNYLNRPGLLSFGSNLPVITELAQIYIYAVVVIAASNAVLGRPVRVLPAFQRAAQPRSLLKILIFALPLPLARALGMALVQEFADPASQGSAFGGGLLLFILAFAARILFLYAAPVIVLEKRGVVESIGRVLRLFGAYTAQNFLRYGLFFVPFQVLRSLASSVPLYIAMIWVAAFGASLSSSAAFWLVQIPLALVILFLNPLGNLIATLMYYDVRARVENYHQDVLAEEMGYQPFTEFITA